MVEGKDVLAFVPRQPPVHDTLIEINGPDTLSCEDLIVQLLKVMRDQGEQIRTPGEVMEIVNGGDDIHGALHSQPRHVRLKVGPDLLFTKGEKPENFHTCAFRERDVTWAVRGAPSNHRDTLAPLAGEMRDLGRRIAKVLRPAGEKKFSGALDRGHRRRQRFKQLTDEGRALGITKMNEHLVEAIPDQQPTVFPDRPQDVASRRGIFSSEPLEQGGNNPFHLGGSFLFEEAGFVQPPKIEIDRQGCAAGLEQFPGELHAGHCLPGASFSEQRRIGGPVRVSCPFDELGHHGHAGLACVVRLKEIADDFGQLLILGRGFTR